MSNSSGAALRRIAAVVVPLTLWISHALWLPVFGTLLVSAEAPAQADAALVLAGDASGQRILRAAGLVQQGYVPVVFVSGPRMFYGRSEDSLAIPFAVSAGFPESYFRGLPVDAYSTREEAEKLTPILRARGVRRLLVVTSDYHTGRAGRLWRQIASGIEVHMVAAPDPFFRPDSWWRRREATKRVFDEWVKTVTSPFGI
ncbi:MAG: YdcF family protein [Bryobacteraceae bacterium]